MPKNKNKETHLERVHDNVLMDSTIETIVMPAVLPIERRIMPEFDPSKHFTDFVYHWDGSLEELARSVSDLRYDRMAQFLSALAIEIHYKAKINNDRIMKARLNQAAHDIGVVVSDFKVAIGLLDNPPV